jgi:hypothetical protein
MKGKKLKSEKTQELVGRPAVPGRVKYGAQPGMAVPLEPKSHVQNRPREARDKHVGHSRERQVPRCARHDRFWFGQQDTVESTGLKTRHYKGTRNAPASEGGRYETKSRG